MREMDANKIREMEFASREIAKTLERAFLSFQKIGGSEKWGFALMIFSFEGPEFTWISNAQRADMVKALQEFIQRNPPNQTSADRN